MRSLLGKLLALTITAGGSAGCTTLTEGGTAPSHDRSVSYSPSQNGRPDPGEVCWAYVPYEDAPTQGKDRPVLIVGTDGGEWLALMLTSKDHDGSRAVKELPTESRSTASGISGSTSAPAPGIGKAVRARCAWTDCSG